MKMYNPLYIKIKQFNMLKYNSINNKLINNSCQITAY